MSRWTRGQLAAVIEDAATTNPSRVADAIRAAGVLGDIWDEAVQAVAWANLNGSDPLRYVAEHNPYRAGADSLDNRPEPEPGVDNHDWEAEQ